MQKNSVAEESISSSPDISKVPEFPLDFDATSSDEHMSSFQEQRTCSDPVSISNSSLLKGSYIGEVARSLGHCNEESLLSFASLRHSSSLPDISDRVNHIERIRLSGGRHSAMEFEREKVDKTGSISPEVSGLMLNTTERDSDSSGTLTDDSHESGSHNGDFSFPPLKEIGSSAFVPYVDVPPVNLIADTVSSPRVIKPGVMKSQNISKTKSMTVSTTSHVKEVVSRNQHAAQQQTLKSKFSKQTADISYYQDELKDQIDLRHESFTNSLGSNISFPLPSINQDYSLAVLPVSSSAMDVLLILQRIVGLGKVLCRTLTPGRYGYDSDHSAASSGQDEDFHIPLTFTKPRKKLYKSFLSVSVFCGL